MSITIVIDSISQTVTATFSDGRKLVVDCSTLTKFLPMMAVLNGVKQKMYDAQFDTPDWDAIPFHIITEEEKYNAMKKIVDGLNSTT